MTRPGDAIILCGDFNHSDSEIGIRAIKSITGVIDSWRSAANKVYTFLQETIGLETGGSNMVTIERHLGKKGREDLSSNLKEKLFLNKNLLKMQDGCN